MSKVPDITKSVIGMLRHLKNVPLEEVHEHIDVMIEELSVPRSGYERWLDAQNVD